MSSKFTLGIIIDGYVSTRKKDTVYRSSCTVVRADMETRGVPGVKLTNNEQAVSDELQAIMNRLWRHIECRESLTQEDIHRLHRELGRLGHSLNSSLADRGLEPKHHQYMLKNREVAPTEPKFYKYMHPIEDLLKLIQDVNANDDPPDVTMGAEFGFRAYSQTFRTFRDGYSGLSVTDIGK